MSTVRQSDLISVSDYLAGELVSEVKHEYVAGAVHAMTGGTNAHNIIAANVQGVLRDQLRDSICREFNSDTKVRIRSSAGSRFYYPDVQMVCQPNALSDTYQDSPVLIAEVLSDSTRRIDEGEKKDSYLSIPSLHAYVMFEQSAALAIVHRRIETGFERLVFRQPADCIKLEEINIELPLADVYRDIPFG